MPVILSIDETTGPQLDDVLSALPTAMAADLAAIFPGGTYTLLEKAEVDNALSFGANTTDVAFTNGAGGALVGVDSGLVAIDGRKLFLYTYSGDNNLVIAREGTAGGLADPNGAISFAVYLQTNGTSGDVGATSANLWVVDFGTLQHNLNGLDSNDFVTLAGKLNVTVTNPISFDATKAPSGSSLFVAYGDGTPLPTEVGVIVTAVGAVTSGNISGGNVVKASQAGASLGGATFGINSQHFDGPGGSGGLNGDAAYFTFVKGLATNVTVPNLDQNESDVESNIGFTQLFGATKVSFVVCQMQGQTFATLKVSALVAGVQNTGATNAISDDTPFTGNVYVDNQDTNTFADIDMVTITRGTNVWTFVEGQAKPAGAPANLNVDFSADGANSAVISGAAEGDKITYESNTEHDRLRISAPGNAIASLNTAFDIGALQIESGGITTAPLQDINFYDDGPSISGSATQPILVVDETIFATDDTKDFAPVFTKSFGADGAALSGSLTYALGINAGATGITDTVSGAAVVLSLVGGVVFGRAGAAGPEVFRISVDASGNVTLDQSRAVVHDNPNDDDESGSSAVTLASDSLVTLSASAKDKDNDLVTATVNIGQNIQLEDDGPSISASATQPTLVVDETTLATNDTKDFAPVFTPLFGNDGGASPVSVSYALGINAGATGIVDTATGAAVVLSVVGGVVFGKAGAAGPEVFRISIDASGNVTLDQSRAVVHDNPNDDDESGSSAVTLAADNLVTLTATATDKDGDFKSATADIGLNLQFEDDGPSISASATQPTLVVDETTLATNDTKDFAPVFTPLFGNDGGASPVSVSYALGINAGATGIVDTATGAAVVLSVVGGVVFGKAGAAGPEVFRISIDASGNVTLDQSRAVVHDNPNDDDESGSSAVTLAADNLVTLTATATDKDGDFKSATADIGLNLQFEDDGPSISASATQPTLVVDETTLATNDTKDFAPVFTPLFGNDGGASPVSVSYALGINAGATGIVDTATGAAVVLSVVGGVVFGKAGAAGPEVFRISIDASGNVTLDQSRAVVHDNPNDDDESGSSAVTLAADNLVTLTATATDKDGDFKSATADIGLNLQFEDDGPSISASATQPTLVVDETTLATNDIKDFAPVFTPLFGNDGGASPVSVSYALGINAGASGIVDTATGAAVVLSVVGGVVFGKAGAAGPEVFRISVDASGNVTLDQSRAVVHDNPNDDDESGSSAVTLAADNLVTLTATATDKDGDFKSATADIGLNLQFEDDGPLLGPISDGIVDFAKDASVTKSLVGVVGSDTKTSPYTLTDWTGKDAGDPAIVISGVTLKAVANSATAVTSVTYWADTNGDTIFGNTGDTAFYRLDLDQAANLGAGAYTFTVLVPPPVVENQFGFGAQPSGQNLFGIIPTNSTAVGTPPNATLPAGGLLFFNAGVKLDSDGKYISSNKDPALNSSTVNTSQAGGEVSIGYGANNYTADNQDAFFVFAANPNTNAVSGIGLNAQTADDADTVRFNGTNEASSASVEIVKIVSAGEAAVTLRAWDLDPTDTGTQMNIGDAANESRQFLTNPLTYGVDAASIAINGISVYSVTKGATTLVFSAKDLNNDGDFADPDEAGPNTQNVTVTLNADRSVTIVGLDTDKDYTIRYDTRTPHDMAQVIWEAGSYNLGGFNVIQALDTLDQKFDFTAKVVDGDGDSASDSWSVGIDGTGIYDNGLVSGVSPASFAASQVLFKSGGLIDDSGMGPTVPSFATMLTIPDQTGGDYM